MFNNFSSLVPTIIIVEDSQAHLRGYSLIGREFFLKIPVPREEVALTLDRVQVKDKYWVVSKPEYLRVVPEAPDFDSDEILIPLFVAKPSMRPKYIKN
jgi:hypothetical protein